MYCKLEPPNLAEWLKGYMVEKGIDETRLKQLVNCECRIRENAKAHWLHHFLDAPWILSDNTMSILADSLGLPCRLIQSIKDASSNFKQRQLEAEMRNKHNSLRGHVH